MLATGSLVPPHFYAYPGARGCCDLQESAIRHGRAAMLATLGSVVHDAAVEPGHAEIVGGAKSTAAHDAFVQAADAGKFCACRLVPGNEASRTPGARAPGPLSASFFWIGLFEFIALPAIAETLK